MPRIGTFNNHSEVNDASLELLDQADPNITWGNSGKPIKGWTEYSITVDYLCPTASWDLKFVADIAPKGGQLQGDMARLAKELQNGTRVGLRIDNQLVQAGYVDQINIESSRGGTNLLVRGRDALSVACDSSVDPHFQFPEGQTVKAFIMKLFSPFGFTEVIVSDKINRQKMTNSYSTFTIDERDRVVEKQLSTPINSKFKAHNDEGCYEFGERLGKRYGFYIRSGVDGKTLFIGSPDFKQEPIGTLIHTLDGKRSNVLQGSVTFDWSKQPSVIIGSGTAKGSGGDPFPPTTIKSLMVNELLADSDNLPVIQKLKADYKHAVQLPRRSYLTRPSRVVEVTKFAKVRYVVDDESATQEHLNNYVRRMMADYQSKFMVAEYLVVGHSQNKKFWAPNTMVMVEDEVSGINQPLWCKAVTYSKSRSGGTTTKLQLILPYTLELIPEG